MVRDRRWWLRPRGSWRIQWGCADELSVPGPQVGSAPETRSHREPLATSLRVSNEQRSGGEGVLRSGPGGRERT